MKTELLFSDKIYPVGGDRRNPGFAGKGIAAGHLVAGRHLYKEILHAIPFKGLKKSEIIGKYDEPLPFFSECSDQVNILPAMRNGDNPGDVDISLPVLDQKDSASSTRYEFTPHNRFNTHFPGRPNKKDQTVQTVGIGQGQLPHALFLGGPAEFFDGPRTPAPGIMGVDVEVDEIHNLISAHSLPHT
jgi:hypothetical protein